MRTRQLPRLEEAVLAARRAYAVDQAEFSDALGAARRLKQAEIEHIGMLFEQQTLLAELERLAGGEL
jgi:outer membrane protein TolC